MAGKLMDNLLKDYAGTHYKWDERGNLIERSRNGEKTVFTWDGYNRMRSAETFGETTSFSYDPLGRRIAKRTRHACTLFGWDGDTLAFESTQSIEGQQEQAWRGDSVHYIHEPGSFVPLVQIRQAQAVVLSQTTDVKALMADNGGRYDIELDPLWNGEQSRAPAPFLKEEIAFYQCDHLGTPQELTDHEGRVAWSASYKAWGEARQAISEAGRKAGFRNPIRFQGQYWDEETGLHYNRHRYYDPVVGRFISNDPIGLLGGLNLQQFAPNPVEWIDPLGLAGNRANRRAGKILRDQEAASGGHPYSRHGAHTTMAEQEHRAKTGIPPDDPCPRNPRPVNSTRFLSNVDQLDAIQRANQEMDKTGRSRATIDMKRVIGEGYRRGGGCPETATKATVFRGANGIITAYPELGP